MVRSGLVLLCLTVPALAEGGPSQAALDGAVQLGTVAALASVCGLREEGWSFDLRRAAIMEATRSSRADDAALEAAAGSALVVGALGYAEAEALERFAEEPAGATCGPLARGGDLGRADEKVRAFRALKGLGPSS